MGKKRKDGKPKHLYLLAYGKEPNTICIGYTHDKLIKNLFMQQRKEAKKHPDFIKLNMEDIEHVKLNDYDFVQVYYDFVVSEDEITYFSEAFGQYMCDAMSYINSFAENLYYLKLNDEDSDIILPLMQVLDEFHHDYTHGIVDDYESYSGEYYNYHNALQFFLKEVL